MQTPTPTGFSLTRLSIRRHIGVLMGLLTAIVLGIFFVRQLPVDLLPSITYPRIGIRLDAPGISPEVAIDEITRPLEQALATTEGAVQIFSQTREGQISLDLYFQPGGDIDQALNDTTAIFNRNRNRLPDTIEEPRIFKVDPTQLPVYEFALTSASRDRSELRVFADEELSRELSTVFGVASANVSGGAQEEVRIKLDLNRMQALGIGVNTVLEELSSRNQDVSGGRLKGSSTEPLIRTVGRFKDVREIENLSFEVRGTQSGAFSGTATETRGTQAATSALTLATTPVQRVYLRDFAEVIDGTEDERVLVQLNGQPAVKVSVQKLPDANTVNVIEGVKQRIEALRKSGLIAPDMEITPTLDESIFIRNSLSNVASAGITGSVLAAAVVLLFLGSLRQTFIISLTIPLCILVAGILMKLFGFSLNIFSMGGLAISVGQAVDSGVVLLENVSKRVESLQRSQAGLSPYQDNSYSNGNGNSNGYHTSSHALIAAVEHSSEEVESSLIASSATNLVSVVPFLLVGGLVALLFNELILTICFAVVASLLIALTVVPMLASRLFAIRWSSGVDRFWLLRSFSQRLEGATRSYAKLLNRALNRPLALILVSFLILGGGSLVMAAQLPQEILPRINTGQANLNAQFPPGTTLETNQRVMERVNEIVLQQPETEYAFTTIGGSLFAANVVDNPLRSSITITLKPGSNVVNYTQRLTRELDKLNLAGVRLRVSPGTVRGINLNNSPVRADVDVVLQGQDPDILQRAGRQVLAALDENVNSASFRPEAEDRQPEIQIRPDWERAASLGLSASDIGETIQTAIQGIIPTQLQRQQRLVDVRVELDQALIRRPSQLQQLPLFTDRGALVQLSEVASIADAQAPGEIQRINQRPVFLAAGTLNKGASLSDALAEVDAVISKLELPDGVTVQPSYAAQSNQELQGNLVVLGLLATFLVFAVMAVQYNSLVDPLVIMFTVPLAIAGGIVGLFVTRTALGVTVLVGVVLLVGIVVNNAIIMIETANQIREEEGIDRRSAILKAAPQRLRPILITTITTVVGLFPLALGLGEGSEFLQPLGVVVFAGMSLATLLTLFIIPCFYILLHNLFQGSDKVFEQVFNRKVKLSLPKLTFLKR
jgi:multidrug efflux pump subunit AcrB